MTRSAAAASLAGVLAGCSGASGTDASGGAEPASASFRFVEVTAEAGLGEFRQQNGDPEKPLIDGSVGGGVALFDFDADGDLDAYLTNGRAPDGAPEAPRDALFVNVGGGSFRDETLERGLGDRGQTCGVTVADVDGDALPDLYLTNLGPNVLALNGATGVFTDATATVGGGDPGWSTGACFLDYDRDGDLDLYVANYLDFDEKWILANRPRDSYRDAVVFAGPRGLNPSADRFFAQEDGRLVDVSEAVGIARARAFGFHALAFDFDLDGWQDVYVANDSQPNFLWLNEEGRAFRDAALRFGVALSAEGLAQAGMGVAVGDFDQDLLTDLFVTNFAEDYHTLYRGLRADQYLDVTSQKGLRAPTIRSLGWACGFSDFDDDGDEDLWAVNGHVYPQVDRFDLGTSYAQEKQLFENLGDGSLQDVSTEAGPGFLLRQAGRGAAVGDVDGDGDLDLLVGNIDGPAALFRNDSPSGFRATRVALRGSGRNTAALGARVVARVGERSMLRLVTSGSGFLSSSEPTLHFGLGDAPGIDELEVTWPSGRTDVYASLPAGALVTIEEGRADFSVETR